MEETTRREIADVCARLHARGWVANHDGNVSVRVGEARFLASPTAVSKAAVRPEALILVDADGKVVAGERKVFSEIALHLACFRARPDIAWVVHAHPPTASGWAVAGQSFFDPPFMAEPVVSLGASIPLVPWSSPGGSTDDLAMAVRVADAVLLQNHGVITLGKDAETAFLRMELVEHLARIALAAHALGGARPIPREDVERLLAARAKAGLNAGSGSASAPILADKPDVGELVREALRRLG